MSHKCGDGGGEAHYFAFTRVGLGDVCACGFWAYRGDPVERGWQEHEFRGGVRVGGLITAPYIQPSPLAKRLAEAEAVMRDMLKERGGTMRLLEFAREQVEVAHGDALALKAYMEGRVASQREPHIVMDMGIWGGRRHE